MRSKNSVFFIVILRVTVATLVFLLVMAGMVYLEMLTTMTALSRRAVVNQATDIASYIELVPGGGVVLDLPDEQKTFYRNAGRFHQYVVTNEENEVLFSSPVAFVDRYPRSAAGKKGDDIFSFVCPYGTPFIGASVERVVDGKTYLIRVAESKESAAVLPNLLAQTFLRKASITIFPFYIVLIIALYLSIRRSMAPLQKASAQAAQISFSSPGVRIDERNIPEEIRPLVSSFNKALDRLEEGIKFEREFIAEAAHELRTPLSVLRAHADTITDPCISQRFRQDMDAMGRLISQMLDKARLNAIREKSKECVDLRDLVRKVCADMWPLLVQEGRPFDVSGLDHPAMVYGDEWAIYGAVRNLISNALIHTPPGSKIEVVLDGGNILVRDYGPGIAHEDREQVFRRFWRKDKSSNQGSGLGLTIVRRVMELHGGTVSVDSHPDGGAVFTLSFPRL